MSAAPCPPAPSGGRLTVDLAVLADNWRVLARRSAPAETGAAVKADGYGLGIGPVATALAAAGCRTFFVALPAEGRALRALLPAATVYVLNGFVDGSGPDYRQHRLRPVLGSLAEIDSWLAESGGHGEAAGIHVDTGMNRLVLDREELAALAGDGGRLAALRPALVMSHFACADTPDHPLNGAQIARFAEVRALLPGLAGSLANSAGVLAFPDARHDLTRPGIALYGGRALAGPGGVLKPVATLEARILQVRTVAAGETVGYGAAYPTRRTSRIAIASVGYADGYLRRAGVDPGAVAAVGGRQVPLAGRVSMDLLAVDVTDADPAHARRGGWVELFGATVPLDEAAAQAGTIGYELLTSLDGRYERRYRPPSTET